MKVMILAAGRGERMGELTRDVPKPMLSLLGEPLIGHQLQKIAVMGFTDVVINVSYLGDQIQNYCGDGSRFGLSIQYSYEQNRLETAGGIIQALPMLGDAPFWVINADVWCDYQPFPCVRLPPDALASLIMVSNPSHHPSGDFGLNPNGSLRRLLDGDRFGFTYAGIGLFSPKLFQAWAPGARPLRPVLEHAIDKGLVFGERFRGAWCDIGTPERLQDLEKSLSERVSCD